MPKRELEATVLECVRDLLDVRHNHVTDQTFRESRAVREGGTRFHERARRGTTRKCLNPHKLMVKVKMMDKNAAKNMHPRSSK